MDRYSRQIAFIGKSNQEKISRATVAIIGLGALGSVSSELLARSGIGKLILIDPDFIELNNLQRQSMYREKDVGHLKVDAARKCLGRINSKLRIIKINKAITSTTIETIKCDIILDCTDNIETRRVINQYCMQKWIPWVYASAIRDEGYVHVFMPNNACYECLFPNAKDNESCCTSGVLNSLTHIVASLQVNECMKIIIGKPTKELIHVNIGKPSLDIIKIDKKCRHK